MRHHSCALDADVALTPLLIHSCPDWYGQTSVAVLIAFIWFCILWSLQLLCNAVLSSCAVVVCNNRHCVVIEHNRSTAALQHLCHVYLGLLLHVDACLHPSLVLVLCASMPGVPPSTVGLLEVPSLPAPCYVCLLILHPTYC